MKPKFGFINDFKSNCEKNFEKIKLHCDDIIFTDEYNLMIENLFNQQVEVCKLVLKTNQIINTILEKNLIEKEEFDYIIKEAKICELDNLLTFSVQNATSLTEQMKEELKELDDNLLKRKKKIMERYSVRNWLREVVKQEVFFKSFNELFAQNPQYIEEISPLVNELRELYKELKKYSATTQSLKLHLNKVLKSFPTIDSIRSLEINLNNFIKRCYEILLKDSNYYLIFNFINIVQNYDGYEEIRVNLHRFKMGIKSIDKNLIIKIVKDFITENNTWYAFHFMSFLGIKKYLDYVPSDKTALEYIEILKNQNTALSNIEIQYELFFEHYYKIYEDYNTCTKEWLKYFTQNRTIKRYEFLHQIRIILEIINLNPNILETDDFYKNKMIELCEMSDKYNVKVKNSYISLKTCKAINSIIRSEEDLNTKVKTIENLNKINCFKYDEDDYELINNYRKIYNIQFKIENVELFTNIINSSKREETELIVYIYMNTYMRYIMPFEDFLNELFNKNYKDILFCINKYKFYGVIKSIKKGTTCRIKIQNVYTLNNIRMPVQNIKFIGDDIYKNIYRIEIMGINNIFNEIKIKNIEDINSQEDNSIISKYLNYYNSNKIIELEIFGKNTLEFNDDEILQIIDLQMNLIKKLNLMTIQKLKKDSINPFRFLYLENLIYIVNRRMDFFKKLDRYKKIAYTISDKYFSEINSAFENLFISKIFDIDVIVYLYMNTVARYIIKLSDFIKMMYVNSDIDNQQILNISEHFKLYPVFFKSIDTNHKVEDIIQFTFDDIECNGNALKRDFLKPNMYMYCYIDSFDFKNNKIISNNMMYLKYTVCSDEFLELNKILEEYIRTQNITLLEKLKDIPECPEFNVYLFGNEYKKLSNYKTNVKNIFSVLINDIDKLEIFLRSLEKNNYWIKADYIQQVLYWGKKINDSDLKLKETFLKQISQNNIEQVFYCYFNSYLRMIFSFEELLRNIFRNNTKEIEQNGMIDLEKYNVNFVAVVKKDEDDYYRSFSAKNFTYLKTKIEKNGQNKIEGVCTLKCLKYNIYYNILYCQNMKRSLFVEKEYNLEQIESLKKIFCKFYKLEEIEEYLLDPYISSNNIYKEDKIWDSYIYNLNNESKNKCQELYEIFKFYLDKKIKNKEITQDNIGALFNIYDQTLLRYCIKFYEFLNHISKIPKVEYNFETNVKIKHIYSKDKAKVLFSKFRTVGDVEIIKSNHIEIISGKYYVVKIKKYDKTNKCILIELIKQSE